MSVNIREKIHITEDRQADFSLPYSFPVRYYETDLFQKPNRFNPWHWHDELQFLIVVSGKIKMTIEEADYILPEGNGIFIPAGLLHSSKAAHPCASKYLCFNVDPLMLSFFRGSIMEQKYYIPYMKKGILPVLTLDGNTDWQHDILTKLHALYKILEKQPAGYELETVILLLSIWKMLLLHLPKERTQHTQSVYKRNEVKEILLYLQTHYAENFSLDQLSRSVCLQKSTCCRLFKQALHCTILEYLTEWRILKSVKLLETTDQSVTQIAYAAGFSDTSYFISRFKKIMHCTPLQYRKNK